MKVNGTIRLDPEGLGMAYSYDCGGSASVNAVLNLAAGTHQIQLMEFSRAGGCTYGTFDFLYAYELPN
ncbi:hypothetical protein [Pyxidicoccus caerfyrddinensis]|uniref:hypothetical protein n=1 Tax=Pyxidicoccus caerfyrddinensis TaxID=2709663 RepID=UPI001F0728D6|nr:hypothetical protein [Pyxidicoccus caerfyrddinensis]